MMLSFRKLLDRTLYSLLDCYQPVRIGTLNKKGRISLMISYIEPYLRKLQLENRRRKPRVIVLNPGRTPNTQLATMYKRVCYLIGDEYPLLRKVLQTIYNGLIRGTRLGPRLYTGAFTEFWEAWNIGRPVLAFSREEESYGKQQLSAMGIPHGSSFMCFCTRESNYYKKLHGDWTHWDWEETFHRNSNIEDYLLAAQYCASQGIYAVRVGVEVGSAIRQGLDSRIIDYATCFRSEFGDIYLGAHCKFVLSGIAGFWWIASAFNRPVVWVNHIPIGYRPVRDTDLFICKKLWSVERKRFLVFKEMIDVGERYNWRKHCVADGIEVVDNSPEEILAVVQEMNERLDGSWVTTDEEEQLQKRFQALYQPGHPSFGFRSRIGTDFLRCNSGLL